MYNGTYSLRDSKNNNNLKRIKFKQRLRARYYEVGLVIIKLDRVKNF